MKKLLAAILFLPLIGFSQTLKDSTVFDIPGNGTIRFSTTYQTTTAVPATDSLIAISSGTRRRVLIHPLQLPISTLAQTALNTKQATLVSGTTIKTYNSESILGSGDIPLPTALQIGLGNVNNTTDASKNSASAVLSSKTLATFNYAADAGSNDTYVISLNPSPGSYTTGMIIFFKANTVNTGAASINVNSLGAKTIVKRVNTTLANGDIPALALCMIIYDGTNFVLLNPVVN